jgi:hypothetical protein
MSKQRGGAAPSPPLRNADQITVSNRIRVDEAIITEEVVGDNWWSHIATMLQMQFEDDDFDDMQIDNIIGGHYSDLLFDLDQCVELNRELTQLMPRIMSDDRLNDRDIAQILKLLNLVQQTIQIGGGVLEAKRHYPIRGVLRLPKWL